MTLTDTRLPDPTARAVHEAIADAFRAVSKRGIAARIAHTRAGLTRVARRTETEPEGVEFWASRSTVATGIAGQVAVAWWTAISGRRHVRVTGRIITPDTNYLLNDAKLTTRPAVWHVFPDRVYRRRTRTANDLVAVCGCGAVGTEKALGWAGPCCGPCADYREEHGSLPWTRPALLPTPTPCRAVAASADGRWAAAASTGEVRVWDLNAGAEPVVTFSDKSDTEIRPQLALAPGGEYLAVAGAILDGLRVFDLRSTKRPVVAQARGVAAVAFRPTAEGPRARSAPTLFDDVPDPGPAQDTLYSISGNRIMVAAPPGARARELALPEVEPGGPLAFSADGSRLAVRRGQQVHVHETGGKTLAAIPFPRTTLYRAMSAERVSRIGPPHVAFSPDGGQVAIGYDQAVGVYHPVTGAPRFAEGALEEQVTGAAFDPGGKWLYVGRHDGTLVAYHTDTFAKERSVVFRWTLGPIRALAPCGDSLLTACDEGAQLWPMAQLLEGA